jgi:hypothetical protein
MSAFQKELQELRAKHDAYIARWKEAGKPVLSYATPCCEAQLETSAPPKGRRWDSLCTCPDCGVLYMKVVSSTNVVVEVPLQEG